MSARLAGVLEAFPGRRVTVLGDAMLDGYLEGFAERVCREAPVPVVRLRTHRYAPGGAANMAANLASLGADVRFVSVIGKDEDAATLDAVLTDAGVSTEFLVRADSRTTIAKKRLVADGQLLVRFDTGDTQPMTPALSERVLQLAERSLADSEALVISDYSCGVLTEQVRTGLRRFRANVRGPMVVDSTDLTSYRSLVPDVVKPSLSEALAQLALDPAPPSSRADLGEALGEALLDLSGARVVALTLDEDGAIAFEADKPPIRLPAGHQGPGPAHPAGAGDTFLAAFTLALSANAPTAVAFEIAQSAAGLVVARDGTSVCPLSELRAALLEGPEVRTVVDLADVTELAREHRQAGRSVVLTNGCFDILHPGHIALLEQARRLGDVLIVGVNSDESVRALKGEGRPVNSLDDRIRVLAALSFVDHVVPFSELRADRLVNAVRPAVYVKGGDYAPGDVPEATTVARVGGRIEILPFFGTESTSEIIARIRLSPVERIS